jgi:hypothetical protein
MSLLEIIRQVRRHLEENGRVSFRMLRREFELDDNALEELIEELVEIQRSAVHRSGGSSNRSFVYSFCTAGFTIALGAE